MVEIDVKDKKILYHLDIDSGKGSKKVTGFILNIVKVRYYHQRFLFY